MKISIVDNDFCNLTSLSFNIGPINQMDRKIIIELIYEYYTTDLPD